MNVADELDRVLTSCWRDKLPVTIQVPSNISYLEVEVPDAPLVLSMPPSDSERLASAVRASRPSSSARSIRFS